MTVASMVVGGCARLSGDTTLLAVSGWGSESLALADVGGDVRPAKQYHSGDEPMPSIIVVRGPVGEGLQAFDVVGAGVRLVAVPLELRTMLTSAITALSPRQCLDISRFVATAVAELGPGQDGSTLAASLRALNELLRPLRPAAEAGVARLMVSRLLGLDETTYLVEVRSPSDAATAVVLRSPEGFETELSELTAWRVGSEVVALGMARMRAGSMATHGWEVHGPTAGHSLGAPPVERDPGRIRDFLARYVAECEGDDIFGLIEASLAALAARAGQTTPVALPYGLPPSDPVLTVIAPIADRPEAVEHQLAQLSLDPAMARCDLLFVLTRSDDGDLWRTYVEQAHALYGVSFRSAVVDAGVAAAARMGIELARADAIVLLRHGVILRTGSLTALASARGAPPAAADDALHYVFGRRPAVPVTEVDDKLLTDERLFRHWLGQGAGLFAGDGGLAVDAPFSATAAGAAVRYDDWLLHRNRRRRRSNTQEEAS